MIVNRSDEVTHIVLLATSGRARRVADNCGAPERLFRTRLASGANISGLMSKPQYSVAFDGRFLMNMSVEGATAPPIIVDLNWDAALKK